RFFSRGSDPACETTSIRSCPVKDFTSLFWANAWIADDPSRRSLPLRLPRVDSVGQANPAKDDRVHEQCLIRRGIVARQVGVALLLRSPNTDRLPGPLASPPHHPRALGADGRIREEEQ